jgi:hypothetical protein
MTGMSAMVTPPGKARRTFPRDSTRVLASKAEVRAPLASLGRRGRAGFWVAAVSGLCATRYKIPFMMSWCNVVCAAKDRHHIPCMAMVNIGRAEGCTTVALHGRGVGGQLMLTLLRRLVLQYPLSHGAQPLEIAKSQGYPTSIEAKLLDGGH